MSSAGYTSFTNLNQLLGGDLSFSANNMSADLFAKGKLAQLKGKIIRIQHEQSKEQDTLTIRTKYGDLKISVPKAADSNKASHSNNTPYIKGQSVLLELNQTSQQIASSSQNIEVKIKPAEKHSQNVNTQQDYRHNDTPINLNIRNTNHAATPPVQPSSIQGQAAVQQVFTQILSQNSFDVFTFPYDRNLPIEQQFSQVHAIIKNTPFLTLNTALPRHIDAPPSLPDEVITRIEGNTHIAPVPSQITSQVILQATSEAVSQALVLTPTGIVSPLPALNSALNTTQFVTQFAQTATTEAVIGHEILHQSTLILPPLSSPTLLTNIAHSAPQGRDAAITYAPTTSTTQTHPITEVVTYNLPQIYKAEFHVGDVPHPIHNDISSPYQGRIHAGEHALRVAAVVNENTILIERVNISQNVSTPPFMLLQFSTDMAVGDMLDTFFTTVSQGQLLSAPASFSNRISTIEGDQFIQKLQTSVQMAPSSIPPPLAFNAPLNTFNFPQTWPVMNDIYQSLMAAGFINSTQNGGNIFANTIPNPTNSTQFAAAALFFITALKAGDLENWIGDKAVKALHSLGKKGLISQLSKDGNTLARAASDTVSQDWRSLALPFFVDQDIRFLSLHYKHHQNNGDSDKSQGNGTRFLFDLNFDAIGSIQIDGYYQHASKQNDARLDMILRSEQSFGESMKAQMRRLYMNAMKASQISGELSFQGDIKYWVTINTEPKAALGVDA